MTQHAAPRRVCIVSFIVSLAIAGALAAPARAQQASPPPPDDGADKIYSMN